VSGVPQFWVSPVAVREKRWWADTFTTCIFSLSGQPVVDCTMQTTLSVHGHSV